MKMSKKSKIVIYILLGLVAIYFLANSCKYLKNLQELARKECDIEKCVLAK